MAFDLGDTVTLTWPTVPASVVTVTVTLTQPDATVAGPFTVTPVSGVATYLFAPAQAGRHAVRWISTGPGAATQAYTDAFDVESTDPGYIVSLADAKAQLRMSAGTGSDDKLRLYIEAASTAVEFYCGNLVRKTYTESYDGGDISIYLRHTPTLSISTLTEYVGNIVYTLTNQPPGASTDAWGFSLDDPASGRVVRRTASGQSFRFVPGNGNINVTYVTGTLIIPGTVRLAAEMIIEHLWESQRGPMPLPLQPSEGETTVPGVNFALPMQAVELLETAGRNPVIA